MRLTQIIEYLNSSELPSKTDQSFKYSHFEFGEHEKIVRKEYKKNLPSENKIDFSEFPFCV